LNLPSIISIVILILICLKTVIKIKN